MSVNIFSLFGFIYNIMKYFLSYYVSGYISETYSYEIIIGLSSISFKI